MIKWRQALLDSRKAVGGALRKVAAVVERIMAGILGAAPGSAARPLPPQPGTRDAVLAGLAIILMFFGGFGAWAVLAPLSAAAIAPGTVRVEGYRKTVQHLEGGIIRDLRVHEGDSVQHGQLLIRLNPTQAHARFKALLDQYLSLQAEEARLLAERDHAARMIFSRTLLRMRNNPGVSDSLSSQRRIFDSRRRSFEGRISILRQRINQLRSQRDGLTGQVSAEESQIALLGEEISGAQELYDQHLEGNTRLLELQRLAAALEGSLAGHLAEIAQAGQAIGETRLEIINLHDQLEAETAMALRETQGRLAEIKEALRAAEDVLRRTDVRAPIAGVVMNLHFFTRGGVVEPGVPILDIVPQDTALVIEAQISPLDIDVVEPDLPAQVRLTAFKQRKTPVLDGVVTQVSADSMANEATGEAYYKAQIEIDDRELARLEGVELYPGMPVEGLIMTGQRTLWRYLIGPVEDSFAHAFREQ